MSSSSGPASPFLVDAPSARRALSWQAITAIVVGAVVLLAVLLGAVVAVIAANQQRLASDVSVHVDAAMLGTLVSTYDFDSPGSTSVDVVQRDGHYFLEDAETVYDLGEVSDGVALGDFTREGDQWCLWVQADNGTAIEFHSETGSAEGRCNLTETSSEPASSAESADLRAAAESDVLALADVIAQWWEGIPTENAYRDVYGPAVVWQEGDTYLINPTFENFEPNPEMTETIEVPASDGVRFLHESGFGPEGWCIAVVTDGGFELRYSASEGLAEGGCLP